MAQAILVKYLGPTNSRGSRVKASCAAGFITVGINHALSMEKNAAKAAQALADKFEWRGRWFMGVLASYDYVFVQCDEGDGPDFETAGRSRA